MIFYEFIDYLMLKMIWWLLLGILFIGFVVIDGFDMGVGVMLLFVVEIDVECCVVINMIGLIWEGN